MSKVPRGRKFAVEIYDQKYSVVLNSSLSESEVRKLAEDVDGRMRAIAATTGIPDSLKVAVLAALHIALENQEIRKGEATLTSKSRELSRALEQVLRK